MCSKDDSSFRFEVDGTLYSGKTPLTQIINNFLDDTDDDETKTITTLDHFLIPKTSKLQTPIFVYNKQRLTYNFLNYKNALKTAVTDKYGLISEVSYSMKANFNPAILRLFSSLGSWCSLVNKNELKLALRCGFKGENLVFNGNGKTRSEIHLAVTSGCYLNIDSEFNLTQTIETCERILEKNSSSNHILPAKILIRINQLITTDTHSYLSTSIESCKFGITEKDLPQLIEKIKLHPKCVKLVGFHCHLGSTIKTLDVYEKSVEMMVKLTTETRDKYSLDSIEMINLGGGLGINYEKYSLRTKNLPKSDESKTLIPAMPTPLELATLIGEKVKDMKNLRVIIEPGRSLVGDSCVLVTKLLGFKSNEYRNFAVVDASMCECIRPCLYSAYHHIDFIKKYDTHTEAKQVDIVGPVCESGDFLGKDRYLQVPSINQETGNSSYLAVMDVGAYCSAMASNYNLHEKPAEILIDEDASSLENKFLLIKQRESLDEILYTFDHK